MFETQNDKKFEFAGYPVEFRVVGNEVLVNCKNVTGTYTQAKAFVKRQNPTNIYPFGAKTTDPAYLQHVPGADVKIACLQDSNEEFMELYYHCEELLGI